MTDFREKTAEEVRDILEEKESRDIIRRQVKQIVRELVGEVARIAATHPEPEARQEALEARLMEWLEED